MRCPNPTILLSVLRTEKPPKGSIWKIYVEVTKKYKLFRRGCGYIRKLYIYSINMYIYNMYIYIFYTLHGILSILYISVYSWILSPTRVSTPKPTPDEGEVVEASHTTESYELEVMLKDPLLNFSEFGSYRSEKFFPSKFAPITSCRSQIPSSSFLGSLHEKTIKHLVVVISSLNPQ